MREKSCRTRTWYGQARPGTVRDAHPSGPAEGGDAATLSFVDCIIRLIPSALWLLIGVGQQALNQQARRELLLNFPSHGLVVLHESFGALVCQILCSTLLALMPDSCCHSPVLNGKHQCLGTLPGRVRVNCCEHSTCNPVPVLLAKPPPQYIYVALQEKLLTANRRPPAQLQQQPLPLQQPLLQLQPAQQPAAAHHAAPANTSSLA